MRLLRCGVLGIGGLITLWVALGYFSADQPQATFVATDEPTLIAQDGGGSRNTLFRSPQEGARNLQKMATDVRGRAPESDDALRDAFASEPFDQEAAAIHQVQIRERLEELSQNVLGVSVDSDIECRSRHCRVRWTEEPSGSVVMLIDALQDERGLLYVAESMMMHRDKNEIHMYLRFPSE